MARLRIDQLSQSLKKQLAPVYLITGEEPLLQQEACDNVRQAAKKQGFSERELYHTDAGFRWDTLTHSANSLSLFAEKKIIEIRVHNGKPDEYGGRALVEYCQNPSEDNLLLLVLPKTDKRTQNTAWFKAVESKGVIVTVWPVNAHQLPHWIEQRMHAAGLSANPQAIEILCAKIEGNLLAAAQEIEKLKLLSEDTIIDAHAMANAVMSSARYNVFGVVDKALTGDGRGAVTGLHGLKSEGTEPTIVLWALAREIRALASIKESMENGKSFEFSAKSNGVWENRKATIRSAVNRLSLRQLHMLLRKASNADKTIKGVIKGDVWNVLLDITLSMSGTDALNPTSQRLSLMY
ncbi:MAG: DNA polymerase-3 subunit delta [Lentisphaeria bacterium]|jgi:DNA polymerase-3 subunit delta